MGDAKQLIRDMLKDLETFNNVAPKRNKIQRKKAYTAELKIRNFADPTSSFGDVVFGQMSDLVRGALLEGNYNYVGPGTDITDPSKLPTNKIDDLAKSHDLDYLWAMGARDEETFAKRVHQADKYFISGLFDVINPQYEVDEVPEYQRNDARKIIELMEGKRWTDTIVRLFNTKKRLTDQQYYDELNSTYDFIKNVVQKTLEDKGEEVATKDDSYSITVESVLKAKNEMDDEEDARQAYSAKMGGKVSVSGYDPERVYGASKAGVAEAEQSETDEGDDPEAEEKKESDPDIMAQAGAQQEEKKENIATVPAVSADMLKALQVLASKAQPQSSGKMTASNTSFPNTPYTGERNLALLQNQASVDSIIPTKRQERETMDWYKGFRFVQAPNSNAQMLRGQPVTKMTTDPNNSLLETNANSTYNIRYKGELFQPAEMPVDIKPSMTAINERSASMFTDSQKQLMFHDRAFPMTVGIETVGKAIPMYTGMNEMTPTMNRYSASTRLVNPNRVILSSGKYSRV